MTEQLSPGRAVRRQGWMILRRTGRQAGPFATQAEAEQYLEPGDRVIIPVTYRKGERVVNEQLSPERAVRLLRAKAAELERKVLADYNLGSPFEDRVTQLAADIALVAQLLADHIEYGGHGLLADHIEGKP